MINAVERVFLPLFQKYCHIFLSILNIHLSYKVNSSTWCDVDGFAYHISQHSIYIGPSHFQFPLLIFIYLHQENFFHCQLNHTFSLFSFMYTNKRSFSFFSTRIYVPHKSKNNKGLHLRSDQQER